MNDIDERLTHAGEQWRAASAPPPAIDIDELIGARPTRPWSWLTIAGAGAAAVLVFAFWRGISPPAITPGASATAPVAVASPSSSGPSPSVPVLAVGSPTPRPSYPPGVGGIHVEAHPATVSYLVRMSFGPPGEAHDDVAEFQPGAAIVIDRTFRPGLITIHLNGQPCAYEIDIVEGVEEDLVLQLAPDDVHSCELVGLWSHALGGVGHPMRGAMISAAVWEGATVTIRSLDPTRAADPPVEFVANSRGLDGWEFPIGPYELTATLNGELVATETIDLTADGGGIHVSLMGLPPSVPRRCGEYDSATCEAAIAAALKYSQWMSPMHYIAVRVEVSTVMTCEPGVIGPLIEVVFERADGESGVTVGHDEKFGLRACGPY